MTTSPYILVLAKNTNEGARYIRAAKLPRGRWRNVASASSIRGIRFATIHKLPSFDQRPDRHAILAELRHAKCTFIDVEMPIVETPAIDQGDGMGQQLSFDDLVTQREVAALERGMPHAIVATIRERAKADQIEKDDRLDERGPMTLRIWNVAHRYNALRDAAALEAEMAAITQRSFERNNADDSNALETENVSNEPPKARRRSRCGSCEELHFADEACAPKPIAKKAVDPIAMFS